MMNRNVIVGTVGTVIALAGILIILWPVSYSELSVRTDYLRVFDDEKAVAALHDAGFTDDQITAMTLLMEMHDQFQTSTLENEIKNQLRILESSLSTRIVTAELQSTRWGTGMSLMIGGLVVAIIGRKQ